MKAKAAANAAISPWCGTAPASSATPAAARAGAVETNHGLIMGRRTFGRAKFLRDNPFCCYCGGDTPSTTVDHVPSTQFFRNKEAPFSIRVPSCAPCNNPLGPSEQVVSFLSRMDSEVFDEDSESIIKNFCAAHPDLALSLRPRRNQIRRALRDYGRDDVANLSNPELEHHVQAVGAKWGFALHFQYFKVPVPSTGGAWVRWWTNANRLDGPILPPDLEAILPKAPKLLRQGKKSSAGQFEYVSQVSSEGNVLMNFIACSTAFALLTVTAKDSSFFQTIECDGAHIHRPGKFLNYQIPMSLGQHEFSVTPAIKGC
jgi:hypothetical protein